MDTSSDEQEMEAHEEMVAFAVATVVVSATNSFNHIDLYEQTQHYVDASTGARDQLATLYRMPSLFSNLTNFTNIEFEEMAQLVCPVIQANARSTGALHRRTGRPAKLTVHQRLLHCLLYLKHDNTAVFEGAYWNWSKSSVCDDSIFVSSCINVALADEIRWPDPRERLVSGQRNLRFRGCIGLIDGTLIKIRRPHSDPLHGRWFNGRKKMYCVNNTVVVDHDGLFIYVDCGYPGSFHDVSILRHCTLMQEWRSYFTHEDHYFEYLLGDPGYVGEDMIIMRRISDREIPAGSEDVVDAFNRVHAGVRIRVEWGIGGMKRKWKRMMKRFDATKSKYPTLFQSACILTNFLHRRRKNMTMEDGGIFENEAEQGWDGDY